MDFQDKVILVTGAASGIGREAALAFGRAGGVVIATDINEAGGRETAELGAAAGSQVEFVKCNVADFTDVEACINGIVARHGRLDIAVNNAGIGGARERTADVKLDDWDRMLAINASGVFYGMRQALRQMLTQSQGGVIVNVASMAGLQGLPNSMPYTAAKHAVVGMTKAAAKEYARKNIRINALCPVFTVTPMFDPAAMDEMAAGISERLRMQIPLQRFSDVAEQVNALLWLASDQSSFVTGLALPVDGGLTA